MLEQSLQALNHQNKEEVWAARIKECRESGKGVQTWCAEHGLSYHTYYKWQQRLYHKYSEAQKEFYEINISKPGCQAAVTVHTGVYSADVYSGADEETIRSVLRAMKTC